MPTAPPVPNLRRVATGYLAERVYGTVLGVQNKGRGFSWHLMGNGGIHSTPREMHRWLRSLRNHEILSEESVELLFSEHMDEGGGDSFYGYGWVVMKYGAGGKVIGHNGGNGFFFADLNFLPEQQDLGYFLFVQ